ncbi:MAG: Lipoprotein [Synergistales bacterium 58_81]|nr:MAG: Lipoprotein [Synergistales bacterium 58_81]
MAFTYASVEYGFDLADGKIKGTDIEHMKKLLVKHAGESQFNTYNNVATGEKADNFLLVVGESIIFGGK